MNEEASHAKCSLVEELERAAEDSPDSEFLRFEGQSYSFIQVHHHMEQVAIRLAGNGVATGDRVAIRLPNGPSWVISWFAIMRIGATAVPTNYAYEVSDLDYVLHDSGAVAVIADRAGEPTVRSTTTYVNGGVDLLDEESLWRSDQRKPDGFPRIGDIELGSLANLQYTSGTTGFPKACMLTHEHWARFADSIARIAEVDENDVMLTAQAFSYIDPQWNTAVCLTARIPLVIMRRFSASQFWPTVRNEGVTLFYVLGTMPALLYKQPDHSEDLNNSVRLVMCSGIPPNLHASLEKRWGAPWREAYGLTETGVDIYVPAEYDSSVGTGIIGWPILGKEALVLTSEGSAAEIGAPGELVLRGKPMMEGYWNEPEKTAEVLRNGWFHTGDLVTQGSDGSFTIVGRLKDMVRRGGENISAAEVENIANSHPGVVSSAVVGVPDELWGEEIKIFILTKPGSPKSGAQAQMVGDYIRQHLARFKAPRYVEFVESFPMTPSERISKPNIPDRLSIDTGSVFELTYGSERHRAANE